MCGPGDRTPLKAALTLSLSGRYRRQGNEAAAGVRLWADSEDVQLTLVDDRSLAATPSRYRLQPATNPERALMPVPAVGHRHWFVWCHIWYYMTGVVT